MTEAINFLLTVCTQFIHPINQFHTLNIVYMRAHALARFASLSRLFSAGENVVNHDSVG